ncbi:vitelline envelope sperm lysin receptor-like isoform X1 [Haliotis cracherodii]|uniref:vitelline envelope sperm lysin receptor-like isoform X1 n=2 Tax=Haliotis cracherodii TaxID=6455 RepID=UPI0039EB9036
MRGNLEEEPAKHSRMSTEHALLALLAFVAIVEADIPAGYILKITPICGANGFTDGSVTVVTDLNADAKAVCAGGLRVPFSTRDGVNFKLPFSYFARKGGRPCVFVRRPNSRMYAAKVIVSYGEPGSLLHQYTEEYTISCSFGTKGKDVSAVQKIGKTLMAPKEIQTNVGRKSGSLISLRMLDVLGNDMTGVKVNHGRKVCISASVTGPEKGIRPVSCDAIDSSNARYAILRAGCGDGIVFSKNKGFKTVGKITTSPVFRAFSINVDKALKFECNFTLCASRCDGNSCTNARRRRGTRDDDKKFVLAATDSLNLSGGAKQRPVGTVERIKHRTI